MRILLASRNPGKLKEVKGLFEDTGWQVVGPSSVEVDFDMVEDGLTFEENARKKARAAAEAAKMWTLADDSGLEVDALNGEPGVFSARYGGTEATDKDRNRRILDRMVAVPDDKRTARFRCVMCLVDLAGQEEVFEGVCEGRIAHHARGSAGFGYDPIFMPDGYSRTFAELGLDVKSKESHRARAIRKVVDHLVKRMQANGMRRRRTGT